MQLCNQCAVEEGRCERCSYRFCEALNEDGDIPLRFGLWRQTCSIL
jgi:hypothetical protein